MKKVLLFTMGLILSFSAKSQMTQSDLVYYVGSGPDTAVIVIDFLDGTADSSYAWGFLFDASATVTGGDALTAIAADEPTLSVVTGGGFLNDITYNAHAGIGASPNYWGTWSRTSATAWTSNTGIGEVLANGDWFGCSYTDFSPAIEPGDSYPAYASNWFNVNQIDYWVGTGSDTAVLVIDFVNAVYGEQVSYAWGYLFNGTTDGATMMADIANDDANLDVLTGGGFLNDIYMNAWSGVAASPYYWGTWSGTNLSDWTLNAGLTTSISNGDWFGASYDDWEPRRPFAPSAAQDSAAFTLANLAASGTEEYIFGSGPDTAVFVFDFDPILGNAFAVGYAFDASMNVSAETALNAISNAPGSSVLVNIGGGFLNDIYYDSFAGIGGAPNYWSTWTAANNGGWYLNTGINEILADGTWFGCSYTDFSPANFPTTPSAAHIFSGLSSLEKSDLTVYPNPTNSNLFIQTVLNSELKLYDLNGRLVLAEIATSNLMNLDLSALDAGVYNLISTNGTFSSQTKVIKQ